MKTIAILSALIAITPFLGVPGLWEDRAIIVFALIIFTKSFYSYRKNRMVRKEEKSSTFKQNDFSDSVEISPEVSDEVTEEMNTPREIEDPEDNLPENERE